jgi:hypothetical protein
MKHDNFKKIWGTQVPPIYTSKKFIEFIKKYLIAEGTLPKSSRVLAGNDMEVDSFTDEQGDAYVVHYSPSTAASHQVTVSPAALEYGTPVPVDGVQIHCRINVGTKDLREVLWGDINPAVNMALADLAGLKTVEFTRGNATAQDGQATRMAADGRYTDTAGATKSLVARISRRSRWFWGVSFTRDAAEAASLLHNAEYFSSQLGAMPTNLNFDPGYKGKMYRWFVLPEAEARSLEAREKLQLLDANAPCHSTETFTQQVSSNPDHPDYLADYRFVYASMPVDVKSLLTTQ